VINQIAASAGYCAANGGPGNPVKISQVMAPKILPTASYSWIAYLGPSLAHELFHACNVYHHGRVADQTLNLQRLATDLVLVNGVPSNVILENGSPAAPLLPVDTLLPIVYGVPDDYHTGNDDCVMRYDDASAHYKTGDPGTLYYTPREDSGSSLCTSADGTGINGSDWSPQPRYGNASFGLGNCTGQILVNDKVAAPRRAQ
jgi:hypothetical protein